MARDTARGASSVPGSEETDCRRNLPRSCCGSVGAAAATLQGRAPAARTARRTRGLRTTTCQPRRSAARGRRRRASTSVPAPGAPADAAAARRGDRVRSRDTRPSRPRWSRLRSARDLGLVVEHGERVVGVLDDEQRIRADESPAAGPCADQGKRRRVVPRPALSDALGLALTASGNLTTRTEVGDVDHPERSGPARVTVTDSTTLVARAPSHSQALVPIRSALRRSSGSNIHARSHGAQEARSPRPFRRFAPTVRRSRP